MSIYDIVKDYTLTSADCISLLIDAVKRTANISGDIVECGVWRGGSMMAVAYALQELAVQKTIWLYDTFEGMSLAGIEDGNLEKSLTGSLNVSIDDVYINMLTTGYRNFKLVKGQVESTLLYAKPSSISLLHLDTDWYDSTKIELEQLYPLLSSGGILIIDDYGCWPGCKKAVDEYFVNFDDFNSVPDTSVLWKVK